MDLSRRELIAAGAAAGAALALDRPGTVNAQAGESVVRHTVFAELGEGDGWGRGWRTTGVANLRRAGGRGVLEAGSDVFPNDPRPVAFAVDCRIGDGEIAATLDEVGSAPGVVLRRRSPSAYYAAIYDTDAGSLRILRRDGAALEEVAALPVPTLAAPVTLRLRAAGSAPTELLAEVSGASGAALTVDAVDGHPPLQRAGDPGVLATAETLFPSDPNPVLPALGNLHLLPWAVQEGLAVMATPGGEAVVEEIRRRSTAAFSEIVVRSAGPGRRTAPSVVAATTGRPLRGGAELHVASDLPARAAIEISTSRRFRRSRTLRLGRTGPFAAASVRVRGLAPGRRVYWRAHLRRGGRRATGPVRSFRVPPQRGTREPFRIAVAACGAQFGPIFEHLADRRPDAFVWQGDLNYPDTHGPLAQTTRGYAGIWRDFLANPLLLPVLRDAAFAAQRDDHDYGIQDANSTTVSDFPWGLAPWKALMNRRSYYRFPAGAAEVWVLDQRLHKTDPLAPDGPDKTLLGERQRRWLMRTLAASRARFKVICSPCTLFMRANGRDGNWSNDFEAERDLLLDHVRKRVDGEVVFLTGDTHLTGVYEADGWFEARAAPVGIPQPNDITLLNPRAADELRAEPGVVYADDGCHLTLLEVRGSGRGALLELSLLREDGAVAYRRSFTPSRAGRRQAR